MPAETCPNQCFRHSAPSHELYPAPSSSLIWQGEPCLISSPTHAQHTQLF